jgi:hypothetical protein
MDKLLLKNKLLENERSKIKAFTVNLNDFINNTHIDYNEARDNDDHSHHHQATTDSNIGHKHLHVHEDHIKEIEAIDFSPSTVVEPGAVVQVNDRYIVVAVAESAFKFDGKDVLSISTGAPLYQCMKGKKTGDTCTINNNNFIIKNIY